MERYEPLSAAAQMAELELQRLRSALTEAWQEIAELRILAERDPLTGIANRRRLMREIEDSIERSKKGRAALLAFIDMDKLKPLNDNFGHHVGDAAILHVAGLIQACVPSGFAARLGGDEFALIIGDVAAEEGQRQLDLLQERVAHSPLSCDSRLHRLSISAGLTTIEADADVSTLLARADAAMYANKARDDMPQALRSAR